MTFQKMDKDLKSADQFWNDFIKKIKIREETLKEVEKKYEVCDEERKTLKASLETAINEKIAVNKNCQDLKDVLQTTENEKNLLNEECKKLRASLNAANEKISKLEKECSRSELSHSEVLNENATLKNALNEAKNANVALTKKCNDLTSSLNDSIVKINDVKTKFKESIEIIKKLKKERKMAHENQRKLKELFDSSWSSPSKTISEVVLSDDDEDELSCTLRNPQSGEKGNSQKVLLVDGSEKKVSIQIHERSDIVDQSLSSDKEISHRASPMKKHDLSVSSCITAPVTPPSPIERPKAGISYAGNECNRISPASAGRTQSNRPIGAVSPRRDVLNIDHNLSPSISTPENKSKTTPTPTKTAPSPVSVANSQSKVNQSVVIVSSTSLRNQFLVPVPSIETKIKPASPNSVSEISNRASPSIVVNVSKESSLPTNVISSREATLDIRHDSVSPKLEKQSIATSSSLKANEIDNRSSSALNVSSLQKKSNQAVSVLSPKLDNLNSDNSVSVLPENQSTAESISPEEKSDGICAIPVVCSQSVPTIVPVAPCSPATTNNQSYTSNKDQNRDSPDSQIDQNFVNTPPRKNRRRSSTPIISAKFPSASKTQINVTSSLPMSEGNRGSRASMLLSRAKDRGCQPKSSSKGNKECSKNVCLQSDSIAKNSVAKENKEPVSGNTSFPEDLMMRHFSNLRESFDKTSARSEGLNFDISCLDSEENSSAAPSSSEGSVSIRECWGSSTELIKYPLVSIPRIDEISEEALYQEMNSSRKAETNKRKSKRRSNSVVSEQPSKKFSQRVIKPKTYE